MDLLKHFIDVNNSIQDISIHEFDLNYLKSNDLNIYNEHLLNPNEQNLLFEIKCLIISLVSTNKINIFTQREYFLHEKFLENFKHNLKITIKTLEYLYSNLVRQEPYFYTKKKNFVNFQKLFDETFEKFLMTYDIWSKSEIKNISFIRRVTLTPSGFLFGIREPEMSSKLLRKFENISDNFLRMNVSDDNGADAHKMFFVTWSFFKNKMENLVIFGNNYKFMGFSASQLRAGGAWFIKETPEIKKEDILLQLGSFDHIENPAKRAARMGQNFSSSTPFILCGDINIIKEPDIKCLGHPSEKAVFSDGIGKISFNIVKEIKFKLEFPETSAIQIRLGGAKGMLALHQELPDNTIVLRDSMVKFKGIKDNHLEILDYNKYRSCFLNRQIILLLTTLGIPEENFNILQDKFLEVLDNIQINDNGIFSDQIMKVFNSDYLDSNVSLESITVLIRNMFNCGIRVKGDPFLQGILTNLKQKAYIYLRKKSNILVENGARILGIVDEYSILNENEVFVCISEDNTLKNRKIIEKQVIVTRNPCLHPGDIRLLNAVNSPEIEQKLGHFINCIIFPQKGDCPIPVHISGGDLDGDLFFVSWEPMLLFENNYPPFNYLDDTNNLELENLNRDIHEKILNFFLEFLNNENLGQIANSHIALADQSPELALDEKCLRLSILHSSAVDFAKSGYCPKIPRELIAKKFPDFMEKNEKINSYKSTTILGKLYRKVVEILGEMKKKGIFEKYFDEFYLIDFDLKYEGWEEFVLEAYQDLEMYSETLESLIDMFGVANEFEIYTGNFTKFTKLEKKEKKQEHLQKRILDHIINFKKYFLNDVFLRKTREDNILKDKNKIKAKASAYYLVSYVNYSHINIHNELSCLWNNEKNKKIEEYFKKFNQCQNKDEQRKFVGMPWFICGEYLIEIKKDSYLNIDFNKKEKKIKKEFENEKNNDEINHSNIEKNNDEINHNNIEKNNDEINHNKIEKNVEEQNNNNENDDDEYLD